ncbi:alpha-xylosidase BoGH31A precursor [mine drainage metagenome]|uniref:Alpha-xylosidase BoGH31A n=1 Tax=mine drainage metagenome TaxID=410659 RepID=A0A1J5RSR5_9ZZZZ
MILKRLLLIAGLIWVELASARAADAVVKSVVQQTNEVVLTLDSGRLELRPLNNGAMRVRFSDGKTAETQSFVLLRNIPTPRFTVRENKATVIVATAKMQTVVDRATGALSFRDADGKTFLAEMPGARLLKPSVVQGQPTFIVGQGFRSPADEKLFGLGQFQDGLWDWRGLPIELRQLNTQIAVPMLISSKGYGLLWDNASRTDFNLPGDEIKLGPAAANSDASGPTATEQLAAAPKAIGNDAERHGAFTSGAAGEYVFCIRDADRRNEIAILVDGVQIAGVKNMWTPRAVVGKILLPANKTCDVAVRGGGRHVKLFARPLGNTTVFRSDCGEAVDYTVFYGPKLDDVVAGYRAATGQAPLWPKWAYGFWQCRERYSSQQQLLDTAAEFRKREIPMDLIVQDWQYWGNHGWGAYEWDESHYPNPPRLLKGLHDMNVKFMISVWCNPQGQTHADLKTNNMLVGEWIDVFDPLGREIRWKHINQAFFSIGVDAWWGDATEPGDPGTDLLGKKISIGPHHRVALGDQFTSAYPLFASEALYDGQRATDSNKRVVILTRSAFPGQQRYAAAAWSGDINGDWETFKRQIPAGLNFCLTGLPYWTTDCGGFFHPGGQYTSADYNELLTRWFEWSTFCPILRIHGYQTQTEMWKWLPSTQTNLLAYDRLRYRMLPYNYSVAWKVTSEASTIMRALGMDFPGDAKAWGISDEYMFGPAFLVAPVTTAKATSRSVYLPGGTSWVNFWTGENLKGGRQVTVAAPVETLPLLVRAGSIVPLGPDLQYAMQKPADPIELRIYPGADGSFTLYEDEGDSYRYEKGVYATIPISWKDKTKTLTIGARTGQFPGMLTNRTFNVVWVSAGHGNGVGLTPTPDAVVNYNGSTVSVCP